MEEISEILASDIKLNRTEQCMLYSLPRAFEMIRTYFFLICSTAVQLQSSTAQTDRQTYK